MGHYKGKTMQHEHSKRQQVKTCQCLRQAFIVASQTTKARHPSKAALHDPSAWQQDEPTLGLGQFDHFQAHALFLGSLCWLITGVSLIHESQLHAVSCYLLHGGSQLAHLSPILLIGRRDMQRQQMPQGIDSQMNFAAFAPLGSIVASAMPTFGTRLQRPTIKNGCRGLFVASL